jgi:hypothetical protein
VESLRGGNGRQGCECEQAHEPIMNRVPLLQLLPQFAQDLPGLRNLFQSEAYKGRIGLSD